MAKRKSDQPNSESPNPTDSPSDKIASQPDDGASPPADMATIASPDLVPPQAEQAPARATVATPVAPSAPAQAPAAPPASSRPWAQAGRLAALAAGIAIAAAVGTTGGAVATAEMARLWSGDTPTPLASTEDSRVLKESIARITADVAALKAAVDTSGRSANSQLVKLGDRLDRFERAQAEPAAKLAKLAEAIERIERRTPGPNAAAAAHDTTGAIAAVAPSPQPQAVAVRDAGPPVLEGWIVRSVYNGEALIQGRLGLVAVARGDTLPGLGRIENIRRQDGRWVVVTTKGLIVAR
jgi:hypothetical protein